MADLYGWVGKILKVDLTDGTVTTVPTSDYVPKWIGGRGIGAKIHWDEVGPEVKAFDPENVLTFMTGPLGGVTDNKTLVQGVSPWKYPVEGYWRTAFGGHWGPELKFAGYDGIVIKGKAAKPVYVLIQDGDVEIREAGILWGKDTYAAQQELWSRHGDKTRVVLIGPAGENLVNYSIIISDDSSVCGMGGMGAVMGAKNLKAIAVRGTGSIPVAKPQELLELQYEVQRLLTRKEGEEEPSNPWRGGKWAAIPNPDCPIRKEGENGTARIGFSGCFACPIACGMAISFPDGSEVGAGNVKCMETIPIYPGEQVDRAWYTKTRLLDRLGISYAFETGYSCGLFAMGILNAENTGITAELGSPEFVTELYTKMAYREGIGDILADNPAVWLQEYIGTPEAIAYYQSIANRAGKHQIPTGWAGRLYRIPGFIANMTSNSGGGENRSFYKWFKPYTHPLMMRPETLFLDFTEPGHVDATGAGDEEYYDFVARRSEQIFGSEQAIDDMRACRWGPYDVPIAIYHMNLNHWHDGIGRCWIEWWNEMINEYTEDHLGDPSVGRKLYTAVTGIDITEEEKDEFCNRLYDLERAVIVRQGHTREDDWPFDVMFDVVEKEWLTRDKLSEGIDGYYTARGLDLATGIPKRSTLEALDLKDVADDLESKYGVTVPA